MSVVLKARVVALAVAFLLGFSASYVVAQPVLEGEESVVTDQSPQSPEADSATAPSENFEQSPLFPPNPDNAFGDLPNFQNDPPNRVTATPASQRRSNQSAPQNFNIRLARAPKMLGDFFGRGGLTTTAPIYHKNDYDNHGYYEITEVSLPNPSAGDIVGRTRIQDNNSPLPQDRIFFDYNYFHNAHFYNGIDVNRFAPGMERTFWGGMASLELRIPMGATLDSQLTMDAPNDVSHYEFGNMALTTKFLLSTSDECALAAGLGLSLPTADDLEVGMGNGTKLISVHNDSPHLLPYLAFLYTPLDCNFFVQSFLTFDFDTSGNPVYARTNGGLLQHAGVWQDQHLATLSVSAGSWLYENYSRGSCIKRIAWSAEAHYTGTLNDADIVTANNYVVGDPNANLSLLNSTLGGHVTVYQTTFTLGYSVPLTSSDRVFDGEIRFFANRAF